jgi:hypothetical protein
MVVSSGHFDAADAPMRSVHGRGYRRTVYAFLIALAAIYLSQHPWSKAESGTLEARVAFLALSIAAGLWLAHRPGVSWNSESITLTSALRARRVAWTEVASAEWYRSGAMGMRLRLITKTGRRLRVPTVMRVDGTDWYSRFWQSEPPELTEALASRSLGAS